MNDTKANSRPVDVKYELLATEEDAMLYAKQMRESIINPHIYKQFLCIMKSCASRHDITGAILQIANLFRGKNTLILGFNKFLPPGFNIVVKNGIVYYCTSEQRNLTPALKYAEDIQEKEQKSRIGTKRGDGKKKLNESIQNVEFLEDKQNSIGKKRLRTEVGEFEDHELSPHDKSVRKLTQVQTKQHNTRSSRNFSTSHYPPSFHTFDELHNEYLSLQKVNETLSQTLNEAELQLHRRANELKAKEKDLKDAERKLQSKGSELKFKEIELEKVTKNVKSRESSLNALRGRTKKEIIALETAYKKAEDVSKYLLREKNKEIEKKDKDIMSKESTIKTQKEEIERLQQELSKAKASSSQQVKTLPEDLLSELECPICLDPFEDPCIVPECCHRFCTSCIENSIKECGKECPLCRKRVTSKRALRKDGFIERITNILFDKNEGKEGQENS
ncbi:E3 ubiquitin-protein ligase RING2-A-like [Chaetoceros tenuissimus]|uniref:RING-type E3 ubiquitin transferase n=1 Tax=Chaetoceros tenuissimus TaxID=426638 RepID=A0AAD3H523_9STRA|nr:E3 ubiquitin-protein ligase RING2-A-like [Chaetoceros tenuissimus]